MKLGNIAHETYLCLFLVVAAWKAPESYKIK